MPTTELTEFKINYLTKAQYEAMKAAGTLQSNEIYMTPEGYGVSQFENDVGYLVAADIANKLNTNGNGSSVTVTFTQASTRTNISSGGTLATIMGRISKFFADLKTVAFTGSYNDLSDKPTIPTVPEWTGTYTIGKDDKGYYIEEGE